MKNVEKRFYKVGRHVYGITLKGGIDADALMPSSLPFLLFGARSADEPLLFEMTVDNDWQPDSRGREIGRFDCGGEQKEVKMLDDGSYQISSYDLEGRLCSLLHATPDFHSVMVRLSGNKPMQSYGMNNALMMTYAFASADKDTVLIHSSVVREGGKGYLCLGVSGTGKSTHTSNWLRYVPHTDLINDDNPVVRICGEGEALVFGSPWSGKTPCYRDVEAPIGAFLQLRQAGHNAIQRQSPIEGFASIMPSCSVMKWDKRDYLGVLNTVGKLLELCPTYLLENLPDREAVKLSYETMTGKQLQA